MPTLFYLLDGEPLDKSLPIHIDCDQSIDHLKTLIKEEGVQTLHGVDVADIAIYGVIIPNGDETALRGIYNELGQEESGILELCGRTKISAAFPNPDSESLYVIAKCPCELPPDTLNSFPPLGRLLIIVDWNLKLENHEASLLVCCIVTHVVSFFSYYVFSFSWRYGYQGPRTIAG